MAWTTPFTATTGTIILASDWNTSGRDDLLYLYAETTGKPYVEVTNSGAQSIANATDTTINYDTETIDTAALHSTVTNNDRINVPATPANGLWALTFYAEFAANATGQRKAQIFHSTGGSLTQTVYDAAAGSNATRMAVATLHYAAASTYFGSLVSQNSGGSLNISAGAIFAAVRLA